MWPEVWQSYALVEGVRLHWAELGESEGSAPLVLLHGINDSYLTWRHVAPALAQGRRVLMPDLPGHGLSERPEASYTLRWHAHIIAEWLARLGLEQVDIVGHSFGGGVAQMLLLERPRRVRRLVLAASGGLGRELGVALRLASLPHAVELLGQPFMVMGTWLALRGSGYSKSDIGDACAINATPGSARVFARTVRDIADWRGQRRSFYDHARELGALPPILVLWGERDTMIPIAHGKKFAESVEGVVFVPFSKCGHYLHHDQPALFVQRVTEFITAPTVVPAHLRGAAGPI